MPFCATCGTPVEGRFCGKCGGAVGATAAPAGSGSTAQTVTSAPMADNVASALAYVLGFITAIIFLVLAPYNQNKTVRFHAFQSLFLSLAAIAVSIAFSFISSMLNMYFILMPLINLCFFGVWLLMLISTFQGKQVVLPIIGPLAQQQAG
jgi:uncharacterized membrane protein